MNEGGAAEKLFWNVLFCCSLTFSLAPVASVSKSTSSRLKTPVDTALWKGVEEAPPPLMPENLLDLLILLLPIGWATVGVCLPGTCLIGTLASVGVVPRGMGMVGPADSDGDMLPLGIFTLGLFSGEPIISNVLI